MLCVSATIYHVPRAFLAAVGVYFALASVLIVVENSIVIHLTLSSRRRCTIGNVFLLMAMSDLVIGLFVGPCASALVLRAATTDARSCAHDFLVVTAGFTTLLVTLLTILLVSINRFVAVARPSLHRSKHCIWLPFYCLIWVYSLVLVYSTFTGHLSMAAFRLAVIVTTALSLLLPSAIYCYILAKTRRRSRKVLPILCAALKSSDAVETLAYGKRQNKISRACFKLVVVLLLMHVLLLIARILQSANAIADAARLESFLLFANAVALTNSAVNPWLYASSYAPVKDRLHRLLLPLTLRGTASEDVSA